MTTVWNSWFGKQPKCEFGAFPFLRSPRLTLDVVGSKIPSVFQLKDKKKITISTSGLHMIIFLCSFLYDVLWAGRCNILQRFVFGRTSFTVGQFGNQTHTQRKQGCTQKVQVICEWGLFIQKVRGGTGPGPVSPCHIWTSAAANKRVLVRIAGSFSSAEMLDDPQARSFLQQKWQQWF